MCFSLHELFSLEVDLPPATSSSARGESTTATRRPCFTISTRPRAATSSSSPPKLFFASLADTRFAILAILAKTAQSVKRASGAARLKPVLRDLEVAGPVTLDNPELMVKAPREGLGVAFVFEQLARTDVEAGQLVMLLEDWCPTFPGMFLYYPGHRHVPPGLRAFIDVLKSVTPKATPG